MSNGASEFDRLEQNLQDGGVEGLLEGLIEQLDSQGRFYDLFSALRLQLRRKMGLTVSFKSDDDDVPEEMLEKWEEGMMAICERVGKAAIEAGQIREGWMYLRPTGNTALAKQLIDNVEADEENVDELVEVLLQEGLDIKRGFGLVLDKFGTCNAITTFESQVLQQPEDDQKVAAELLLRTLHSDLITAVKAEIAQQEDQEPAEETLAELVTDRDYLFGEHSYLVDTTHLASTVRFARLLSDEELLRVAIDLTEYGRRLSSPYQYEGDEPFSDLYPSHALYFKAMLGEDIDAALAYFLEKAKSIDAYEEGTMAVEIYIELLDKLGRPQDAIDAMLTLVPDNTHLIGVAPTLPELSAKTKQYQSCMEFCKQRDDLVGYATALALANEK